MSASASTPVSTAAEASSVPETSPINAPHLRDMIYNGFVRSESDQDAGESNETPMDEHFYYFWRNGKWFFRAYDRGGPNPEDVVLLVEHPKNKAVRDALEKLQRGIPAKPYTTLYLMEGIRKWIDEKRGSVVDQTQEEAFVKYVWNHVCHIHIR